MLSIVVGPEPVVLEIIPRYAYVGDYNIIIVLRATGVLPTVDLSCKVGPLHLDGIYSNKTTVFDNGTSLFEEFVTCIIPSHEYLAYSSGELVRGEAPREVIIEVSNDGVNFSQD